MARLAQALFLSLLLNGYTLAEESQCVVVYRPADGGTSSFTSTLPVETSDVSSVLSSDASTGTDAGSTTALVTTTTDGLSSSVVSDMSHGDETTILSDASSVATLPLSTATADTGSTTDASTTADIPSTTDIPTATSSSSATTTVQFSAPYRPTPAPVVDFGPEECKPCWRDLFQTDCIPRGSETCLLEQFGQIDDCKWCHVYPEDVPIDRFLGKLQTPP